jgi:hypothetical protein
MNINFGRQDNTSCTTCSCVNELRNIKGMVPDIFTPEQAMANALSRIAGEGFGEFS